MISLRKVSPSVTLALVLTFLPSQPRRKSSLPGGSAAKVSEPRPQKNQLKQQGGASSSPPVRQARFPGFRGCRGRLLWVTFLGETRKVTCRPAAPGQRSVVLRTPPLQRTGPSTSSGRTGRGMRFDRLRADGAGWRCAMQYSTKCERRLDSFATVRRSMTAPRPGFLESPCAR